MSLTEANNTTIPPDGLTFTGNSMKKDMNFNAPSGNYIIPNLWNGADINADIKCDRCGTRDKMKMDMMMDNKSNNILIRVRCHGWESIFKVSAFHFIGPAIVNAVQEFNKFKFEDAIKSIIRHEQLEEKIYL